MTTRPLEDYALIGDCRTAALVGKDGSIDWWCTPRFDSPACFAALVGTADNGMWQIAPAARRFEVRRRYRPDTLILETEFRTATGRCRLTDFMPMHSKAPTIVRQVTGIEGRVPLRMKLVIRPDHGHLVPWVARSGGDLVAIAGPQRLVLRTDVSHRGEKLTTVAEFETRRGRTHFFALSDSLSYDPPPPRLRDVDRAARDTERFWRHWAARCTYQGEWRDAVVRSLITIKALIYRPTGGMVAAPTTSLPEMPGGQRNWDYRFCWLRDSTFVLLTLMRAGYRDEADAWRAWLERAVAGLPSQLQPIYSVTGEHRIEQRDLPWLAGYARSSPVREGNEACEQLQLDTYGEVMDALHHARRGALAKRHDSWSLQCKLLSHLETLVDRPDKGMWESRGRAQHFVHSKAMCWVAFDRGVATAERYGLPGPVARWRKLRDRLHAEICRRGFNRRLKSFTRAYGSSTLDASTLLLPLVGFLPADDPRVLGTVAAVRRRLMKGGLVHRYDTRRARDGLPHGEAAFLACTCWLADNLALQGRRKEARRLFERVLAVRNDVGLLAEEYDIGRHRQMGNFPQALSHLALVGAAYSLSHHDSPAKLRSRRQRRSHI
jgi:GH15 family glucan-1,4-alpha-glucosidase